MTHALPASCPAPVAALPPRDSARTLTFSMPKTLTFSMPIDSARHDSVTDEWFGKTEVESGAEEGYDCHGRREATLVLRAGADMGLPLTNPRSVAETNFGPYLPRLAVDDGEA